MHRREGDRAPPAGAREKTRGSLSLLSYHGAVSARATDTAVSFHPSFSAR